MLFLLFILYKNLVLVSVLLAFCLFVTLSACFSGCMHSTFVVAIVVVVVIHILDLYIRLSYLAHT